jgi:predicted translin family RNA/ssDNA-binding protein
MPMFEVFRKELDEHYDRRERIIKASRDITAASKKMCVVIPPPTRRNITDLLGAVSFLYRG